jgi:RNA polymerase sigma factor (sigma-70 family)
MPGNTSSPDDHAAGDATLLRAFAQARRMLTKIAGKLVGTHDIEDIVQETFLRTYEASRRAEIRHPRAFMESTVRNLALNFVARMDNQRKDSIDELLLALDPQLAADLPLAEDVVDSQERLLLFYRALQRLPTQCRRVFVLKRVYGLSRQDIALRLGIAESGVQKHLARGMVAVTDFMATMEGAAASRERPASRRREPEVMP